jgi:predicted PurR-regulated permease PerM
LVQIDSAVETENRPKKMVQTHRISAQAWFALLGLALTTWLIISYTTLIFKLGWILLGALLLSLAIRPVVDRFERWRIPRGVTTVWLFLLGLGVLALLGAQLIPVIQAETAELRQRGPMLWQTMQVGAMRTQFAQLAPSLQSVVDAATGQWETVVASAVSTVAEVGGLLLNLMVILFLAYFLAVDERWAIHLLLGWIPQEQHAHVRDILKGIAQRLTRWVWAQAALSLFFAVVFSGGLWLLGIPFALTIGMVGGVLTIVPYVGGLLGAVLAILGGLTLGLTPVLWVVILVVVVVVVQTHVLAPLLYGKAIALHSALALLALFIGVEIAGVVGALFAVPVAVIVTVVVQELQERVRHDPPSLAYPPTDAGQR